MLYSLCPHRVYRSRFEQHINTQSILWETCHSSYQLPLAPSSDADHPLTVFANNKRSLLITLLLPFGSLSAHDYLASLALSQMSQNNLQGMYLSSRAKYRAMSLIGGKSFGIMNCLQFKILFLGIYEQSKIKAYFASSKSIKLYSFAIYFLNHLQSLKYLGS